MAKSKEKIKTKKKVGRPQKSNKKEIQDAVCKLLSETTLTLRQIQSELSKRLEGVPPLQNIMRWLQQDLKFREQYTRAREAQCEIMADEIQEISDDDGLDMGFTEEGKPFVNHENINRSRLRVDTRKWLLSKRMPKKYSDKLDIGTPTELKIKVVYEEKPV